jgi:DNA-binding transcriptional ArsR family regulator
LTNKNKDIYFSNNLIAKKKKVIFMQIQLHASDLFKVLSVDTRIKIIELLKERGPLCVNEIAEKFDMTTSAVSQHLKILKQTGFVESERKGYWIHYSINEEALEKCHQMMEKTCCCGGHGFGHQNIIDLEDLDLETLRNYQQHLQEELNRVQEKIEEMESGVE